MLLTILLSAAQMAAAAATSPLAAMPAAAKSARFCVPSVVWTGETSRAEARRLDQLPSGRLELTVLQGVGECLHPVVLREGIGGNPDRPLSKRR